MSNIINNSAFNHCIRSWGKIFTPSIFILLLLYWYSSSSLSSDLQLSSSEYSESEYSPIESHLDLKLDQISDYCIEEMKRNEHWNGVFSRFSYLNFRKDIFNNFNRIIEIAKNNSHSIPDRLLLSTIQNALTFLDEKTLDFKNYQNKTYTEPQEDTLKTWKAIIVLLAHLDHLAKIVLPSYQDKQIYFIKSLSGSSDYNNLPTVLRNGLNDFSILLTLSEDHAEEFNKINSQGLTITNEYNFGTALVTEDSISEYVSSPEESLLQNQINNTKLKENKKENESDSFGVKLVGSDQVSDNNSFKMEQFERDEMPEQSYNIQELLQNIINDDHRNISSGSDYANIFMIKHDFDNYTYDDWRAIRRIFDNTNNIHISSIATLLHPELTKSESAHSAILEGITSGNHIDRSKLVDQERDFSSPSFLSSLETKSLRKAALIHLASKSEKKNLTNIKNSDSHLSDQESMKQLKLSVNRVRSLFSALYVDKDKMTKVAVNLVDLLGKKIPNSKETYLESLENLVNRVEIYKLMINNLSESEQSHYLPIYAYEIVKWCSDIWAVRQIVNNVNHLVSLKRSVGMVTLKLLRNLCNMGYSDQGLNTTNLNKLLDIDASTDLNKTDDKLAPFLNVLLVPQEEDDSLIAKFQSFVDQVNSTKSAVIEQSFSIST